MTRGSGESYFSVERPVTCFVMLASISQHLKLNPVTEGGLSFQEENIVGVDGTEHCHLQSDPTCRPRARHQAITRMAAMKSTNLKGTRPGGLVMFWNFIFRNMGGSY